MKFEHIFFKEQIKKFKISRINFSLKMPIKFIAVKIVSYDQANANGDIYPANSSIIFNTFTHHDSLVADPPDPTSYVKKTIDKISEKPQNYINKYSRMFFAAETKKTEKLLANAHVRRIFYVNIRRLEELQKETERIAREATMSTMRSGSVLHFEDGTVSMTIDSSGVGIGVAPRTMVSMNGRVGIGTNPAGFIDISPSKS
jgi:hypothetical protein